MATAAEHYRDLLANHYTWMSGGHAAQVPACMRQFQALGFAIKNHGTALDLGCGSGFQSLALAELGYDVLSIDTSAELLEELRTHASGKRIEALLGDIRNAALFSAYGPFAAAVCMGDTLTHLSTFDEVTALLKSIHAHLAPDGKLVLGFRDLTRELTELDRLIPVRSDADKIMTVFLEYEPEHVVVHDMIYAREDGQWVFAKSAYRKLRLSAERIVKLLEQLGFRDVIHTMKRGFSTIVANT